MTRSVARGSAPALIEMDAVSRWHDTAAGRSIVLDRFSLRIRAGEMVAIRGASGSGKSTLLHILGGLDFPSSGSYRIHGHDVGGMAPDALAAIRSRLFGFVFQRYHLIPHLTALENVCVPLSYAGAGRAEAERMARDRLVQVGLHDRLHYRPAQLSGGQQQRVGIARALANGGSVIFADEPTGALDARSGAQIMDILCALHAAGHTVVIVTHDAGVAARAARVIEIEDGRMVSDIRTHAAAGATPPGAAHAGGVRPDSPLRRRAGILRLALREAARILIRVPLRSALTMLGIAIGVGAVASVVAVGQGSRDKVLRNISSLGANTIEVAAGSGLGDLDSRGRRPLSSRDAALLVEQTRIDAATPVTSASATVRAGRASLQVAVLGVSEDFPEVYARRMLEGAFFGRAAVAAAAPVVVIDQNLRERLFPPGISVLGRQIMVGPMALTIVGVERSSDGVADSRAVLQAYVPHTSVGLRLDKAQHMMIAVRVPPGVPNRLAQAGIFDVLRTSRGAQDFYTRSLEQIQIAVAKAARTFSLMILAIAAVSLVVGGIGVMNMMLVSVYERTHEIGVRMALGASAADVLTQFLTEALVLCALGGVAGVAVSVAFRVLLPVFLPEVPVVFSWPSVAAGLLCSSVIGLVFGYAPARRASRLRPVDALANE